jgi:hypothetical protein
MNEQTMTPPQIDSLPPLLKLSEVLTLARRSESWWHAQKAREREAGVRLLPKPNQLGLYPKRAVLSWLDLR